MGAKQCRCGAPLPPSRRYCSQDCTPTYRDSGYDASTWRPEDESDLPPDLRRLYAWSWDGLTLSVLEASRDAVVQPQLMVRLDNGRRFVGRWVSGESSPGRDEDNLRTLALSWAARLQEELTSDAAADPDPEEDWSPWSPESCACAICAQLNRLSISFSDRSMRPPITTPRTSNSPAPLEDMRFWLVRRRDLVLDEAFRASFEREMREEDPDRDVIVTADGRRIAYRRNRERVAADLFDGDPVPVEMIFEPQEEGGGRWTVVQQPDMRSSARIPSSLDPGLIQRLIAAMGRITPEPRLDHLSARWTA